MNKLLLILAVLIFAGGIFLGFFYTKRPIQLKEQTVTTPIPTPTETKKFIHLYPYYNVDGKTEISKINIITAFFVAKGQKGIIKNNWNENLGKVLGGIKYFFENQFQNKIAINYKIAPVIHGDHALEIYDINTLAVEAFVKTATLRSIDSYNIWMIYVVRDSTNINPRGNLGAQPVQQAAVMDEFWLDDEAVSSNNSYGLIGSAHEFGHVLGIPHPWELPANTAHDPNFGNVRGDLMGYLNSAPNLQNLFIRDDVKKEMGL